jgi:CRISPR/Cas system-associated endoribonuclease Cas2
MGVFEQQMEKEQIKELEREINAIIKKSSDMKDVFEGYLD